jgi:hypothetical protein
MSDKLKTTPKDYTFKYQGKNPLEKLREGEPYFFLRAQDKLSPDAIRAYAEALRKACGEAWGRGEQEKGNELMKQALGVLKVVEVFMDWQDANEQFVKLPD